MIMLKEIRYNLFLQYFKTLKFMTQIWRKIGTGFFYGYMNEICFKYTLGASISNFQPLQFHSFVEA